MKSLHRTIHKKGQEHVITDINMMHNITLQNTTLQRNPSTRQIFLKEDRWPLTADYHKVKSALNNISSTKISAE